MTQSTNSEIDKNFLKNIQKNQSNRLKNEESHPHYFYGHGKLLLTGEYLVMDGAKSLALPSILGQSLSVKYKNTFMKPRLNWKSYSYKAKKWLEADFELWRFDIKSSNADVPEVLELQNILRKARDLNPHFLRETGKNINVETRLEFPLEWGLGSSSTLLYNIAQWAYISPFELAGLTYGGSGYDIACAQSMTPIVYELDEETKRPSWQVVNFRPYFLNDLYFVHLGSKQKTRDEIQYYKELDKNSVELESAIEKISFITEEIVKAQTFDDFNDLLIEHEEITSNILKYPRIQKEHFSDFKGTIKSLGAWGGDFVLATYQGPDQDVEKYFKEKGLDVVIPYKNLICDQFISSPIQSGEIQ